MGKGSTGKLIVIAGDGMDPRLCDKLIAAGKLPTLERLCQGRPIGRLATTLPPQSPVAWTSALTGVNPGRHGIFDFLRRDPAAYAPSLGLYDRTAAGYATRRRAPLVTERLARAGLRSLLLRIPGTFPPPLNAGDVLCGQGTPDLAGTWGRSTVFDTETTTESGSVMGVRLAPLSMHAGAFWAELVAADGAVVRIELRPQGETRALALIDEQQLELRQGVLSDFIPIQLRSPEPGASVRALVRLRLLCGGERPRLYCSALMSDPSVPAIEVSAPAGLAAELARSFGRFATLGWAEDTWALAEGHLGYDDFLAELELNLEQLEQMAWWAISQADYRMVMVCFEHTDRVSHMFGHLADPEHVLHDPKLAARHGAELHKAYQRLDAFCGKTLDQLGPHDALIVCSDHGFAPFAWQVNINSWLAQQGYLALRGLDDAPRTLDELFAQTCLFSNVAWEGTRAYGLGLSSIYLNLEGREGQGIVPRGRSSEQLIEELAGRLAGLTLGDRRVFNRVLRPDRELWGAELASAPDLVVGTNPGFRVAWQSALGGLTPDVLFPNRGPWASDHCSTDPLLIPGIVAASRPIRKNAPWIGDLAATMLGFFGIEPDEPLDGADLFAEER